MLLRRILFYIWLMFFGVVCTSFYSDVSIIKTKWIVLKGGALRVNGSTNINTFSCTVSDYKIPDTLTCLGQNKDGMIQMAGNVSLDIFGFDCHNPTMTADLRKTLKAKENPVMKIYFISLSKFPELKQTPELIKGWVNIELTSVTKRFEVSYKFYSDESKIIHLLGDRSINFSDFNLTPPKKLGGIIRANDRLDVEFSLNLQSIN